ncbi:MAG: hypothetical protein WAX38_05195 [Minisyncoccia bacterium]
MYQPQQDGHDVPRSSFESIIESSPYTAALIIEAYAFGARDRDVAGLLTETLVAEAAKPEAERIINYKDTYIEKKTIIARLTATTASAKGSASSDTPAVSEERYREYVRFLKSKFSNNADVLMSGREQVRERVRTFMREKHPAGFWLADPDARKFTRALILHESSASPEKIALALTTFGIKLSKKQLESRMGASESARRSFADELLTVPESIQFSDSDIQTYTERAHRALGSIESAKRERKAEKLDFMQNPHARALVAGLLSIRINDPVSLHGRVARHVVPYKTIAKLVTDVYPSVVVSDITLKSLVQSSGGNAPSIELRGIAVRQMEQGQDAGILSEGKRRAEELWRAYAARLQERTFLQSPLFRNTEACALAHVLLTTDMPLQGIASVLEEKYKVGITKSLMQLLVLEEGTRLSAAQKILHYKNADTEILTPEVLAHARALQPQMFELYFKIRQKSIRDVSTGKHTRRLETEIFSDDEEGAVVDEFLDDVGSEDVVRINDKSMQDIAGAVQGNMVVPEIVPDSDDAVREQNRIAEEMFVAIRKREKIDGYHYMFTDASLPQGSPARAIQISFASFEEVGTREQRWRMQQFQKYLMRMTSEINLGNENALSVFMRRENVQSLIVRAFSIQRPTAIGGQTRNESHRAIVCKATLDMVPTEGGGVGRGSAEAVDVVALIPESDESLSIQTTESVPRAVSEVHDENVVDAFSFSQSEIEELIKPRQGLRRESGRLTARMDGTRPIMKSALILTFTYPQLQQSEDVRSKMMQEEGYLFQLAQRLGDMTIENPLRTYMEKQGMQVIEIRKMGRKTTTDGRTNVGVYEPQPVIRAVFGDLE